ncbi:MAG: hypothetical protein N2Z62_16760 [Rhodobacteraceae bacterium]|nr:hypothetical protein [Paracoccaceae bacterium]
MRNAMVLVMAAALAASAVAAPAAGGINGIDLPRLEFPADGGDKGGGVGQGCAAPATRGGIGCRPGRG